jgi:hypothetical protein
MNASIVRIGVLLAAALPLLGAAPLGLPEVPIPADNPMSPEKIALGNKLFHDTASAPRATFRAPRATTRPSASRTVRSRPRRGSGSSRARATPPPW